MWVVELPPNVVDPDFDDQPIWLQIEYIWLPAGFKVSNGVPGYSHIDDIDGIVWIDGCEGGIY